MVDACVDIFDMEARMADDASDAASTVAGATPVLGTTDTSAFGQGFSR